MGFTCLSNSAPYQALHDWLLHRSLGFLVGTKKGGKKEMNCMPNGKSCIQNCPEPESSVWLPFWGQRSVLREARRNNHKLGSNIHKRTKVKASARSKQDRILCGSIYDEDFKWAFNHKKENLHSIFNTLWFRSWICFHRWILNLLL